ncbi:MAG: Ribosomal large subunit methyltransferase [Myxococcaceae bacterium]|nr:Ribosomal large subunit methyltransferase [Myxococcaceae bacterium]
MTKSGRPNDAFGAKAKKEGFAARSVYKLEEIDRKNRLFRRGMRVLDLGAFPGSWTQYASNKVGAEGHVLAVDQQEWRGGFAPNVETRQCDVLALTPRDVGGVASFDVVMSDMAPWTTGTRFVDQCRSFDLYVHALSIAEGSLRGEGHFIGKIFQGPDFDDAKKRTQALFSKVRVMKPEASRQESYEIFVIGLGFRG